MAPVPTAAPRRMTPSARRDALLAAAARVLHRRPLGDLRFELVAEEAGVSTPLLYRYFASVDDLAATLFERVIGGIDRATPEVVEEAADVDDAVAAVLGLWCDAIEADGPLVGALLDGRGVAAVRPLIDARDRWAEQYWSDLLVERVGLDRRDAAFVAVALTTSATAALAQWVRTGEDRAELIDRFTRLARGMVAAFADVR